MTKIDKINIDSFDKQELLSIIKDVQYALGYALGYALDGKLDRASDLHYDTGIPMDECDDVLKTIKLFLSIDTNGE